MQVSLWSLAVQSAPLAQFPGLQRAWHSLRVKPLPGAKSQTSFVLHSLLLLQPASTHATRGLPCKPGGQTQMAVWKSTSHSALLPHWVVKQGFTHSWDLQALSRGQSLSTWHSTKSKIKFSLKNYFHFTLIYSKPTLVAFSVWVTSPTTWAATNWPMGCGVTKCTLATRTVDNTGVKTLIFNAGSVVWTVNVMLTFTSLNYK